MFSNTLLALDTILNTPGNYDCKALSQDASKKKKKKNGKMKLLKYYEDCNINFT